MSLTSLHKFKVTFSPDIFEKECFELYLLTRNVDICRRVLIRHKLRNAVIICCSHPAPEWLRARARFPLSLFHENLHGTISSASSVIVASQETRKELFRRADLARDRR